MIDGGGGGGIRSSFYADKLPPRQHIRQEKIRDKKRQNKTVRVRVRVS